MIEVEDTFMYIPLLDTLQTLLDNDAVLAEVCSSSSIPFSSVSLHIHVHVL